ncbi:GTP-binding protein [Candidatus Woesearchaeota archaeon CG10_big_fil_rev_8_21_14_0_10_30_7]|nr:MAG: GTP-binding protein [Candidatus Woesearchaeota archaeon CG10_big_fil_rev_8_21_14_0_10_30_7]
MVDYEIKIKELEDEMRKTQYNKATEHHFGVIKAKIAKLRDLIEKKQASKKKGEGFAVKKSGDATVILLGFPSVGKSTLLNALTGAKSEVGHYEFTTLDVIPGVLNYKHAKIQILDIPGIIEGASKGRGRGREILSMLRSSNLIIILIDALHPEHYEKIKKELFDSNIRINQEKPIVKIVKKPKGGLSVGSTIKQKLDRKTIEKILREMGLNNADVVIRTRIDIDQLIDSIEGNRAYVPSITIITKADLLSEQELQKLSEQLKPDLIISAEKEKNIVELKEVIFKKLKFIRVYLKEINKQPDMEVPLIVEKGTTIKDVCEKLHRGFVKRFRYARLWGPGSKFDGQVIKKMNKELQDEDILEIHLD